MKKSVNQLKSELVNWKMLGVGLLMILSGYIYIFLPLFVLDKIPAWIIFPFASIAILGYFCLALAFKNWKIRIAILLFYFFYILAVTTWYTDLLFFDSQTGSTVEFEDASLQNGVNPYHYTLMNAG